MVQRGCWAVRWGAGRSVVRVMAEKAGGRQRVPPGRQAGFPAAIGYEAQVLDCDGPMTATDQRIEVTYHVHSDAASIAARAEAIALEQSVELPRAAVTDARVAAEIVGRVDEIIDRGNGSFAVTIGLAVATAPPEAGQLMNMLFGNTSLQEDVTLADVVFPPGYAAAFGGPALGIDGVRRKVGAGPRALTASALKPQGLPASELARLAGALAFGGLDIVKDDHGLADQAFSPFAERVVACGRAVRSANAATGRRCLYAPSLSGSLDQIRGQLRLVREEGLEAVLVAPMVMGLPTFQTIVREFAGIVFLAHPSMAGAARVSPEFLLGRMFRLLGADVTIFPNYGGAVLVFGRAVPGDRNGCSRPVARRHARHPADGAFAGRWHDARPRAGASGFLRSRRHFPDRREPSVGRRRDHRRGGGLPAQG